MSYEIRWRDDDADPTGLFQFYYQVGNVPPGASQRHPALVGRPIGEVPVSDPTDALSWDLTSVSAGAYYVYGETDDPPYCLVTFSRGLVVVRRDGEPAPLGGLFLRPSGVGDVFDAEASLEIQAVAPETPRVTVRAGTILYSAGGGPAQDCDALDGGALQQIEWSEEVARDVSLEPDPMQPGHFRGRVRWATASVPAGDYVLEATLSVTGREPVVFYAPGLATVYHPSKGRDAGVSDGGTGDGGGSGDAGTALPVGAGCCGGGSPASWIFFLPVGLWRWMRCDRA